MDQATVQQILKALRTCHLSLRSSTERVDADLERALSMLPESGTWAVANLSTPAVFFRSGPTFFTVIFEEPDRVALTSRTLDTTKLAARLEWGEPDPYKGEIRWRQTKWTFRIAGEEEFLISLEGTVSTHQSGAEEHDRYETFARELAELAGWRFGEAGPLIRAVG